jgi:hypothetical protein
MSQSAERVLGVGLPSGYWRSRIVPSDRKSWFEAAMGMKWASATTAGSVTASFSSNGTIVSRPRRATQRLVSNCPEMTSSPNWLAGATHRNGRTHMTISTPTADRTDMAEGDWEDFALEILAELGWACR